MGTSWRRYQAHLSRPFSRGRQAPCSGRRLKLIAAGFILVSTFRIAKIRPIESRHSVPGFSSEAKWILLALAALLASVFFRLGDLPLEQPDEGRNAEVAREMKLSGAWLVPTYNGIDYLDKPAFYFKTVALSLAAFGDSETAARLPSALFATALVALIYWFCRREFGVRCAGIAAIALATTPLFLINARTVIFDIALAFFTVAAIFAGYLAERSESHERRRWYLIGAAAAGFATLVKGPVGFLVPILVLLIFNAVSGNRGAWKRLFGPLNLLVFFAVTLPWFVGLCLAHRDFAYYGLVEESFHRFTTTAFHRSKPFYFYGIVLIGMFLPWSLLLPAAAVNAWKSRREKAGADVLCVVWLVAVVVFFSLSKSKMPGYILSTTAAGAILVARWFDQALAEAKPGRAMRYAGIALSVICLVATAAVIFLSSHTEMLARPLGISATEAAGFKSYIPTAVVMLFAFSVLALTAVFRRNVKLCLAAFALFPVLLVTVNYGMLNVVFSAKSARTLAQQIPPLPPQTELACLQCFPAGLPFYLQRTATLITKDGGELTSNYILFQLKTAPAWPSNLVAVSDFDRWLAARDHPVYLIVRNQDRARLEAVAAGRASIQQLTPQYAGALLPPS
jgi:4-amino-4-deoxy-L-arabinose transferase-like glycosyltransferase